MTTKLSSTDPIHIQVAGDLFFIREMKNEVGSDLSDMEILNHLRSVRNDASKKEATLEIVEQGLVFFSQLFTPKRPRADGDTEKV